MEHKIKLAFAVGINGEFGNKGGLPWGAPISADMIHFQEFTKDCVLVMGKETFKSLPKALDDLGRICIVTTTNRDFDAESLRCKNGDKAFDVALNNNLGWDELLQFISKEFNKDVCVIGGASLVEQTASIADEIMFSSIIRQDWEPMESDVMLDMSNVVPKRCSSDTSVRVYKQQQWDTADFKGCTRWMRESHTPELNWYER